MEIEEKRRVGIFLALLVVIFIECGLGFAMTLKPYRDPMLGGEMVKAMYDYGDDLSSIEAGYTKLAYMVSEDVWEQIRIDNPYRYATAYYHFKQETTHVEPVFESPGIVLYSVKNIYINPAIPWVLTYEMQGDTVVGLHEYKLVNFITTTKGAF